MKNTIKNVLLLASSLLIWLPACISQNANTPIQDTFPMNEYLTTSANAPYPSVAEEKFQHINTSSFINIMNFGASGNGKKADDDAIIKAFAACKNGSGIIFPQGKTFLIQNLLRIPLNKDITVYAYGATFKMADNSGYNAMALEGDNNGYNNQVLWLGGTLDGNKDHQAWPGSPTGNNTWMKAQGNYGLLTIRRAKFALVKDITLTNSVYDGVELYECQLGVIADSKAENGVPLEFSKVKSEFDQGKQATYFKVTRQGSQVAYFLNLTCTGGSIGIHYSSKPVNDSSLAVVANCKLYNQAQDALHFEHCRQVFLYKNTIGTDNSDMYHADVHISNETKIASIKDCQLKNGRIDFRTASKLQLGIVENCQFESYALRKEDAATLKAFIQNATFVKNCTFKGRTKEDGVKAKYITGSSFETFDTAANAMILVNNCRFNNGLIAIKSIKKNITITGCDFKAISSPELSLKNTNGNASRSASVNNITNASIGVADQRKKFLGYITDAQ